MTKWFHKVSLKWLQERQKCLTATDVMELLPVTKTGRPRKIGDEQYLKVYARKKVHLVKSDCESTGVMARGHVLESYAIDEFNFSEIHQDKLYHWDDLIITKPFHTYLGLGFSPDAMDIKPPAGHGRTVNVPATAIAEVKCFSADRHYERGCTDKMQLEERWQIAVAMAVCTSIKEAYLLFYNPSVEVQMFYIKYDRMELADEIDTVLDVEDKWLTWLDNSLPTLLNTNHGIIGKPDEEQEIIDKIIKDEELNPEGEKTVMR